MDRFICVHGHFYQPPRENPWLEAVEQQDSAYPYHDWNARITAECYAANAAARLLDGAGRIEDIVNNYARISFNFGPTLLGWLAAEEPEVYAAILRADAQSRERFSGHGSAIAQAYNHMIMPLANRRDKVTQVRWGIADFERHFGRAPEGLWLPETAVDLETLDVLAEHGMQFTVLAPHQAATFRKIGAEEWTNVSGGHIDPTRAYRCMLPSGRTIALFFYDGPISRGVAFEHLLSRGEQLAERLAGGFNEGRDWPQLVHIATDGETYGHHHRAGEMALAYALRYIEERGLARITNYGEYLEQCPPDHEVQIAENTSWSCVHGVERWRSNCGCNSGAHANWNQAWRAPLRAALDWLRDAVAPAYEQEARKLLRDPWAARDAYFDVVQDRSPERREAFLAAHARRALDEDEQIRVWKLLELQRHAMLMYTSCGWFFDDLSGIETVQVIQYAGRAVQLAQELFVDGTEEGFAQRLAAAQSNLAEHGDGRQIYEKWIRPSVVDLRRVGAHYAISSLFEAFPAQARVYCYRIDRQDYMLAEMGRSRLATGQARVTSEVTQESTALTFAVAHFGDQNLTGGVRRQRECADYEAMAREVQEAFERMDMPELIRRLDRHLEFTYALRSAFRDEQRKIAAFLLEPAIAEAEATYRRLYAQNGPLARYLSGLNIPLPAAVTAAAGLALNSSLRRAIAEETLDPPHVHALLEEARRAQVTLDGVTLSYALQQTIERMARQFAAEPDAPAAMSALSAALDISRESPFGVDLWRTQNRYYEMAHSVYPEFVRRAGAGDEEAQAWVDAFTALGDKLGVQVPDVSEERDVTPAPSVVSKRQAIPPGDGQRPSPAEEPLEEPMERVTKPSGPEK